MSDRLPVLLWGDIVKGKPPVLRRALAGERAHECMYAWVYLTEYLTIERLRTLLPTLSPDERRGFFPSLNGSIWNKADRKRLDPYYQVSQSSFDSVVYMTMLAKMAGALEPQVAELGSTFFASKLRFDIVDQIAREVFADQAPMTPQWVGIDNSPFMHDTTRLLHGDDAVTLVTDTKDVPPASQFSGLISRFVASYVFPTGKDFVDFANRFRAVIIEDAYSTTGSDVSVYNHGQPETFYSLTDVFQGYAGNGFEIHVLSSYPDHPGGSAPCHIVKYLAIKKPLTAAELNGLLEKLGFPTLGPAVDPATALAAMNAKVTEAHWAKVKRAKFESPVWGPTPEGEEAPAPAPAEPRDTFFNRLFPSPTPPKGDWEDYQLGGPQAEREIARAVAEEIK